MFSPSVTYLMSVKRVRNKWLSVCLNYFVTFGRLTDFIEAVVSEAILLCLVIAQYLALEYVVFISTAPERRVTLSLLSHEELCGTVLQHVGPATSAL